MRNIIGMVAAVAALGLAASTVPTAAQHHGGLGGIGHAGPAIGMGHVGPSIGMAHPGPAIGTFGGTPRANFAAAGGNFAARTLPNMAWNAGPGWHGRPFDHRRRFRGFAFGFGGPYWADYGYDYGPNYAYDYDYGYDQCYALQRVFIGGRWRLRRVWVCG